MSESINRRTALAMLAALPGVACGKVATRKPPVMRTLSNVVVELKLETCVGRVALQSLGHTLIDVYEENDNGEFVFTGKNIWASSEGVGEAKAGAAVAAVRVSQTASEWMAVCVECPVEEID